jgi:hypothetical protein
MGTETKSLPELIVELKGTVTEAAAHPFLPSPARMALLQTFAIMERIAAEQHQVSEMLRDELQVREERRFATWPNLGGG